MTLKQRLVRQPRGLWLWATALLLALLAIMPMSTAVMSVSVALVLGALAWRWRLARAAAEHDEFEGLPSAGYRQPVVLVCGDGLNALFDGCASPAHAIRRTGQGCYLAVPHIEALDGLTERLRVQRPEWAGQLSVMFVINPGAHTDSERLAGRLQALRHQLKRARRRGPLPLWVVSYLQSEHDTGPWFTWHCALPAPQVFAGGVHLDLADWQRQGKRPGRRLDRCVQLNGAAAWLSDVVLAGLQGRTPRDSLGPAWLCAVSYVPVLPDGMAHSLWQQWLRHRIGVFDTGGDAPRPAVSLPFPDALLHLLPVQRPPLGQQPALLKALWITVFAGLIALSSSAWHNRQWLREVSADLQAYSSASPAHPARRAEALAALQRHAAQLDHHYRHGEPWALGLGLYRGEHLRAPLLAALAQSPSAQPGALANRSRAVRLDSLSLFSPGSAQLKPESTKVLVSALVDIKAQPGWLIVIAGHTDATGSAEHNLQLSRARAAAVRDWMAQMGDFHDSCFAVQGFGASQPIARNDSEKGRAANRRVDIRLVPEAGACGLATSGPGRQPLSHSATAFD